MARLIGVLAVAVTGLSLVTAGCGRESAPAGKPTGQTSRGKEPAGGHGASMALGSATSGPFTIEATRAGGIAAGGEAPIDVHIKSSPTVALKAVRFWIGNESAQGSIKAKASIENPKEPEHWHTHAEVPSPLPADAKLWVEIEPESGDKQVASFDLKAK